MDAVTVNQRLAAQVRKQRAAYDRPQVQGASGALEYGAGLLGAVPGIGDALGFANDINQMRREPEQRTGVNLGLAALGLIPFVPSGVGKAAGAAAKALPKAPQQDALRTAQKNAVRMLGLPPSNTAMDRARAMGFQDGLYHGGTNDFSAFHVSDRKNVYASDDPRIADIYATATGRHKALREVNAGPNVIPLMYRGRMLEVSDQGPTGGGWYSDNLASALKTEPKRTLLKEVPKHGYSGVKITDMDDLGGRQAQYVFPDPKVLRSRFAAFDPARVNENDMMGYATPGMLGALALGSLGALGGFSALRQREEEERRRILEQSLASQQQ